MAPTAMQERCTYDATQAKNATRVYTQDVQPKLAATINNMNQPGNRHPT